ncbi:MAG: NADH:ubiquinone reductase (Na(+)-transporting) subunit E [Candidatus Algichlamydia australiensis]|nr:NADH:ubiquinone reductase (Na(+)-transporting) subunit E [Chlamydiales bacterium]
MGNYSWVNLIGLAIQSIFIQNILLFYFLGMCSYLACSAKIKTANGLGLAVIFVTTISGTANWFINHYLTGDGALSWLSVFGIDPGKINLNFLQLIIYISVIAALVQVLEIFIEKFSPPLYRALGMYLPLITVNCAILGASLFATVREYPIVPHIVYVFSTGIGWWIAILLIASIREKLTYSNVVPGLKGMGITFIMTGLISLSFMGFAGISLDKVAEDDTYPLIITDDESN